MYKVGAVLLILTLFILGTFIVYADDGSGDKVCYHTPTPTLDPYPGPFPEKPVPTYPAQRPTSTPCTVTVTKVPLDPYPGPLLQLTPTNAPPDPIYRIWYPLMFKGER